MFFYMRKSNASPRPSSSQKTKQRN